MSEELLSPRIAELRRRIESGDAGALAAFWTRAAAEGTPIVEPAVDDDAYRLVTFVYRAPVPHANVAIFPGLARMYNTRHNLMTLLAGTDLWYRTYRARADLRVAYHISPDDPLRSLEEMSIDEQTSYTIERAKVWLTDPLNPARFEYGTGAPPQSLLELPDAPSQPYLARREGVPEGTIEREDLVSDPFGAGRRIWTYLPPGYDADRGPYPLLLLFDGWGSRKLGTHITLDNMIADGVIPPTVAVMIHQLDRNTELSCNQDFADWLAADFVPSWIRTRYAVTTDPARTVVSGASLGGLAAAWCGLTHPEVFGNVISQSGSYWWPPDGESHEWLTRQYAASPRLPLRFHIDVGLLEDGRTPGNGPSMVDVNRRFRDMLQAKGYDLRYTEYNGGHDYVSWRGTLADGLAFLLGLSG